MVPDPLSGAQPLRDGMASGDLGDKIPSVWERGKALVWALVPPPRSQLCVKVGARAPFRCGVGATVSDILIVNPVVSLTSLYIIPSTSQLDMLL